MSEAMIIALMEKYPNDADLGNEIRKIAINLKKNNESNKQIPNHRSDN